MFQKDFIRITLIYVSGIIKVSRDVKVVRIITVVKVDRVVGFRSYILGPGLSSACSIDSNPLKKIRLR